MSYRSATQTQRIGQVLQPAAGGFLRRRCECGQHTLAGGECATCNASRQTLTTRSEYQPGRGAQPAAAARTSWWPSSARPLLIGTRRAGRAESALYSFVARQGKAEAAYNAPEPEDDNKKTQSTTAIGALAGASVGAVTGAGIGGMIGGPLGFLVGLGIGALVGAGIGALVGWLLRPRVSWDAAEYTSDNTNGSSTTVEKPFRVSYRAVRDEEDKVWRLRVASIRGGAKIHVRTGGSRNPITNPPTSEAEAKDAVNDMKGYYNRGSRGSWHTEAASRAHEEFHYREWKCSADYYWPTAKAAIEKLSAPLKNHANEAAAVTTMRAGPAGADAKMKSFRDVAHRYWFTLADNAKSRPYAAGQRVLNNAITHVQDLAGRNGWTVAGGIDRPRTEPPCYQPRLAYNP